MAHIDRYLPEITLDFHPAGFYKGIFKAAGVLATTFAIGGLEAVLPQLQDLFSSHGTTGIILLTGGIIATVKGAITWLTTKRNGASASVSVVEVG